MNIFMGICAVCYLSFLFPRYLIAVKVPSHYSAFILTGGAAEQAGTIEAGDEILAINGKPLVGLMHFDAWNIMKSVPEGPVQLVIRKHRHSS